MSRYRILTGFLSSDPGTHKSIIVPDGDVDLILNRAKEINKDFQLLSTMPLTRTEALTVDYNKDLFECVIDSDELKRRLEHHRRLTRDVPLSTVPKKKKTESDEEAKPFRISRTSMATRLKSRIW